MSKRYPLELEISSHCPLLCNICVNKDIENKSFITDEDFYYAIDYIAHNLDYISILDISGVGDIFTHPHIKEYLLYIGSVFKDKDIFIIIPTKGTIVQKSHIHILEKITQNGVNISISLGIFSIQRKKHDLITGVEGSFDKTFTFISQLRKTSIRFSIELAVSQFTKKDIPHFIKLCEKLDVGYQIIQIHSYAGSLDSFDSLQLRKLKISNCQCRENEEEVSIYPNFHCERALPTITADGTIRSCSHGRINDNYIVGKLQDVLAGFKHHGDFLDFIHTKALNKKICSQCPVLFAHAQ